MVALAALAPTPARCDTTVVAVAYDGPESALVSRVRAELGALGYEVRTIPLPEGESQHEGLRNAARMAGAVAAIRIVEAGDRVGVWVADLAADRITLREVEVPGSVEDRESAMALEAVELLRVSLMELTVAPALPIAGPPPPAAPPGDAAGPADVEERPAPPAAPGGRLSIELGPAVFAAGFESAPTVNLSLGISARIWRALGAELLGVVPLVPSRVQDSRGDARIHFGMVGGGLRATFGDAGARWRPAVGAGFGALFFRIDARAEAGYTASGELVASGAPYLRAGLSLALTRRLGIRLDAVAGWALGETVVRFDGREVASFGQPWLGGILSLEVWVW
jgi:hypothetical protein